ncbi:MAG: ribonuclease [Caulobacter sp.]|jgi:ribonuclease T2|nr:ribonuclease [Caulobacter sp.]
MRLALSLLACLSLTACAAGEGEVVAAPAAECAVPAEIEAVPAEVGPSDKVIADFTPDTYLLSLAWQPEACRSQAADTSDPSACDSGRTWTLHGLWPNSADGKHPRYCRPSQALTEATVRKNFCMIPSARLQQHEYAAHGVCAWDSPEAYFDQSRKLWEALKKPVLADTLTAGALRDAFAAANPGLPREAVAIATSQDNRLREVRLCHDLAFRPAACAPKALGARDDVLLTITPPN